MPMLWRGSPHANTLPPPPPLWTPSREAVGAAVLLATDRDAVASLLAHYGDLVDISVLLRAAAYCGAAKVMRLLSSHALDWQKALPAALKSHSLPLVRFLVEEKGAAVDPYTFVAALPVLPEIASFVCARMDPFDRQRGFDMGRANPRITTEPQAARDAVRRTARRVRVVLAVVCHI